MIASRVTAPVEEKGVEVDGAEGVGRVTDLDCLEQNYALLRLMVVAFIAPIMWKWSNRGKGIEKWRKILAIAEGKMSLSRVAESLCTSMIEIMK